MTHLPFVAAAYAMGLAVPAAFGLLAWQRLVRAKRRLRAVDPREARA